MSIFGFIKKRRTYGDDSKKTFRTQHQPHTRNERNETGNTFNSNDSSTLNAINVMPTFNPLDKLVETYDENKKLYERLLQAEKEKTTYLEQLLKN